MASRYLFKRMNLRVLIARSNHPSFRGHPIENLCLQKQSNDLGPLLYCVIPTPLSRKLVVLMGVQVYPVPFAGVLVLGYFWVLGQARLRKPTILYYFLDTQNMSVLLASILRLLSHEL